MKQTTGIDAALAARLLAGEASESEKERHRNRLAGDADYRSDWAQWLWVWDAAGTEEAERRDCDVAWTRLQRKTHSPLFLLKGRTLALSLAAAAVLLLALLLPLLWTPAANQPELLVTAGGDEIQELVLEDGTRVSLNTNSRLSYPEEFGPHERRVFLSGEAWFEVEAQGGRPFYVETDELLVKVVGTAFNVRSWPESAGVSVEVGSGRVEVHAGLAGAEHVLLQKGEGLVFHRGTQHLEHVPLNPNYLAWKTGQLYFEDTPLSEVLQTLERTYRRPITADHPSIFEEKLGGSFSHQSFEYVVEVLCATFQLEQSTVNGVVVLSRQ